MYGQVSAIKRYVPFGNANHHSHAPLGHARPQNHQRHKMLGIVPRQDLTGADRTWFERYEVGNVLRYSRSSKETSIGKGEYAPVKSIDAPKNRLTVELKDGTERTYDPRGQHSPAIQQEPVAQKSRATARAHERHCSGFRPWSLDLDAGFPNDILR
jgi:hypothetical protein